MATPDRVLTIPRADPQRFANLLLAIGVRMQRAGGRKTSATGARRFKSIELYSPYTMVVYFT